MGHYGQEIPDWIQVGLRCSHNRYYTFALTLLYTNLNPTRINPAYTAVHLELPAEIHIRTTCFDFGRVVLR